MRGAWNEDRGALYETPEPLGWVEACAPDTINIRCDKGLFFDSSAYLSWGNDAHYSSIVDNLDPRYVHEPNLGLENWVQAVAIRECRRLWQLRHWTPALLEDRDHMGQDAYDYMRWFLYFAHDRRGACDARRVPFTMEEAIKEVPDHVG